jgi:hypothetical protein
MITKRFSNVKYTYEIETTTVPGFVLGGLDGRGFDRNSEIVVQI